MIERGEAPRDVIGRVESGRARGDQTDAFGHLGQGRQEREWLERGHRVWLRLSASMGMLSTAMWSAMKKASNFARSSD
jgi:hypothetical protein